MSSSSAVAKSSVIVCCCPEALTDETIHQGNDERWGFTRYMVKERGSGGLDRSYLRFTTEDWWANVRVFKLLFKAPLLRVTSCNKGQHCGGDAWGDCGGVIQENKRFHWECLAGVAEVWNQWPSNNSPNPRDNICRVPLSSKMDDFAPCTSSGACAPFIWALQINLLTN